MLYFWLYLVNLVLLSLCFGLQVFQLWQKARTKRSRHNQSLGLERLTHEKARIIRAREMTVYALMVVMIAHAAVNLVYSMPYFRTFFNAIF